MLYALAALASVVFGAFFLVGYDRPWAEDMRFNAPLLTDAVLALTALMLALAVVVAVVAVVVQVRRRDGSGRVQNGVPVRRIWLSVAALLGGSLLLTLALGSTQPMLVNGKVFADGWWLRLSDMFIHTSLVLLVVAVGAVICSNARNIKSRS